MTKTLTKFLSKDKDKFKAHNVLCARENYKDKDKDKDKIINDKKAHNVLCAREYSRSSQPNLVVCDEKVKMELELGGNRKGIQMFIKTVYHNVGDTNLPASAPVRKFCRNVTRPWDQ